MDAGGGDVGGGRGSDTRWRHGLRQYGSQSRKGGRHGWRWVEVTQVDTGGSDVEWTRVEAAWVEVAFDKAKLL